MRLSGREIKPFRYRNLGSLATIGRGRAVADFGWLHLSGGVAWLLWGLVHIAFLIGFRNRIMVLLQWLWSYVTFKRGARLITGPTQSHSEYTNFPVVKTATAAIDQATSWASS